MAAPFTELSMVFLLSLKDHLTLFLFSANSRLFNPLPQLISSPCLFVGSTSLERVSFSLNVIFWGLVVYVFMCLRRISLCIPGWQFSLPLHLTSIDIANVCYYTLFRSMILDFLWTDFIIFSGCPC